MERLDLDEAIKTAEEFVNSDYGKKDDTKPKSSDPSDFEKFKSFVNQGNLAIKQSNGKLYLLAEAWLYLAHIKGLIPSVKTRSFKMEDDDENEIVGVEAICELKDAKTNEVVSTSVMVASSDESFLQDKPLYAVYGMAETRAISRAVRNVYGYIAKGAGFESTPASEVDLER